ncbi:CidA/LrgA family protein [Jeongeupia naejangsanensis]|uniref:CidA/LrgA family protein n=1 Tax=Jeongeupia naejangsanensis TaxID=613195 RepID=A0ABS2BPB6_9NEIS|nr:CidA/LrgA family protein [Jeongeupia naejangsanensis]MBM3117472.1 CidA/LrgA family protein [Jeongeupia naejangsanensis]
MATSRAASLLRLLAQLLLIFAIWFATDWFARAVHSPIPGSVIGLGAVLALLMSGLMPADTIRRGAEWLLAEMLLFFIPPCIAVVQFGTLFKAEGLPLIAVIGLGTLIVMAGTALVVDVVFRWEHRRRIRAKSRRRELAGVL